MPETRLNGGQVGCKQKPLKIENVMSFGIKFEHDQKLFPVISFQKAVNCLISMLLIERNRFWELRCCFTIFFRKLKMVVLFS